MRSQSYRLGLGALVAIGVAMIASAQAAAGSDIAAQPRSRDILARIVTLSDQPSSTRSDVSMARVNGLGFTRDVEVRGRDFQMHIRGPVYRSAMQKRKFGLRMELTF